jgi:hypothetical protein
MTENSAAYRTQERSSKLQRSSDVAFMMNNLVDSNDSPSSIEKTSKLGVEDTQRFLAG